MTFQEYSKTAGGTDYNMLLGKVTYPNCIILLLFLICLLPKSATVLIKITLPASFARQRGAHCLDGSPPALFLRQSPSNDSATNAVSSRSWLIVLPGGDWCRDYKDCAGRSHTFLGSSHVSFTFSENGALSLDCIINPDYCKWNMVVFLYCDGGTFLGNRSDTVDYNTTRLYMRGARVFDALVEYLGGHTSFKDAEQVILTGVSAGGIGAIVQADLMGSRLPKSVTMFKVIIDAAMFVDVPDEEGKHNLANLLKDVYEFHSIKDTVSAEECIQTKLGGLQWRCVLPQVYQPFVGTPTFFSSSLYDTWLSSAVLGVFCSRDSKQGCPTKSLETIQRAGDAVQAFAKQVVSSKMNGVFLTACPRHPILMTPGFYDTKLGNQTLRESIASWMSHDYNNTDVGYATQPSVAILLLILMSTGCCCLGFY